MQNLNLNIVGGLAFVLFFHLMLPIQHLHAHSTTYDTYLNFDRLDKTNKKGQKTIELVYFKGKLLRDQIMLSWMSATQSEPNGFSIEMKMEDQHWEKIGWVDAYSESWNELEYRFEVEDLMTGQYFFRLAQTSELGLESYSEVVSMNYTGQPNSLLAYPNPAGQYIFIEGPPEESISNVKLYDQVGNLLYESNDAENVIPVIDIPTGRYLIVCKFNGILSSTAILI